MATEPQSATAPNADPIQEIRAAIGQLIDAISQLFDVLPLWANFAAGLFGAALIGLIISLLFSRRGGSREDTDEEAPPPARPTLPRPESPAFKSYQLFLEQKGVSAKERDQQMRAFAGRHKDMRQSLRDLVPGNRELHDPVEDARDALDAGDFDLLITLLTGIGERENTDGLKKRNAAIKHLMAAAISKAIIGDMHMARLEYNRAAESYRQAAEALPPFQQEIHAEYLNKYGTASYQAGQHNAAIAAFEGALRILQTRLGKYHPDVATALNNLGLLHYSRGNYEAAEPLYKRALAIDEQTLGNDHVGVATDLNNLALLYKKKGDLESAEPLLRRAMGIKEKNFGPGHPSLITGLRNYASLMRALGREDEAVAYDSRANVLPPSRTDVTVE